RARGRNRAPAFRLAEPRQPRGALQAHSERDRPEHVPPLTGPRDDQHDRFTGPGCPQRPRTARNARRCSSSILASCSDFGFPNQIDSAESSPFPGAVGARLMEPLGENTTTTRFLAGSPSTRASRNSTSVAWTAQEYSTSCTPLAVVRTTVVESHADDPKATSRTARGFMAMATVEVGLIDQCASLRSCLVSAKSPESSGHRADPR